MKYIKLCLYLVLASAMSAQCMQSDTNATEHKFVVAQDNKLKIYDIKGVSKQDIDVNNATKLKWNIDGRLLMALLVGRIPGLQSFHEADGQLIDMKSLSPEKRSGLLKKIMDQKQ